MVNIFNRIRDFFNFIRVSYYLLKFTFMLGRANNNEAKILITQTRWRISKTKDDNARKQLLNFLDTMEKVRFPNEKNNIL